METVYWVYPSAFFYSVTDLISFSFKEAGFTKLSVYTLKEIV